MMDLADAEDSEGAKSWSLMTFPVDDPSAVLRSLPTQRRHYPSVAAHEYGILCRRYPSRNPAYRDGMLLAVDGNEGTVRIERE
jgi:hypothetical protein